VKNTSREISIDYIQKVICDYFDMPIDLMKSKTRKREIVQARQLTMYFAKKLTKYSLASIGAQCGNKDHATVLHACRTVSNLIDTDKKFRSYVDDLKKKLTLN
jgi:chromosomal replication initiator protein